MRHPERADAYLADYKRLPEILRGPFDFDEGDWVMAILCNREALVEVERLQAELAAADAALAEALRDCSDDWRGLIQGVAALRESGMGNWEILRACL